MRQGKKKPQTKTCLLGKTLIENWTVSDLYFLFFFLVVNFLKKWKITIEMGISGLDFKIRKIQGKPEGMAALNHGHCDMNVLYSVIVLKQTWLS